MEECWSYDRSQRKTLRCVGDPDETERVEQVFRESFFVLKEIFIEKAAETNYPKVGRAGFESLLVQLDLISKQYPVNYFAAHFDASIQTDDKSKRSRNCNRAQFFELLMRLARDKYYNILKEVN